MTAYVECLDKDKNTPGLALWLQSRDGDYLTFRAFWVGTDTSVPAAKYDAPPLVDGGTVVSKPDAWIKGSTEDIVVKRNGNNDLFISLRVGGKVKSKVIVKDPPDVVWDTKPVSSEHMIHAASHGPNPGCSAGAATDCIYPIRPGGYFVAGSGSMTERSSSDPGTYHERITTDTPNKICVEMIQNTGACEVNQSAQGRLTALEKFPRAAE
jgi:hypothetical protein